VKQKYPAKWWEGWLLIAPINRTGMQGAIPRVSNHDLKWE